MAVLTREQRNQLERAVLKARDIAEAGAAKALHTLGVGDPDAPSHLSAEERALRRALRAQARQLGDNEDSARKGYYSLPHLIEKIGYDQWHRMLFARLLAENDLLMSPEHGVAVSLEDCNELASELGLRDGWAVAARFASGMLPQIFRADDPAGKINLAPEDFDSLERQLAELPQDTFMADDALGWVYQFWQAKRKDEINSSGKKIGADELAPVTQLFTEDYMVQFLLHNTLGAWWAGKHMPEEGIVADTEQAARATVALIGVGWEYLRLVQDERTQRWKPAAGVFPGWPRTAKELRILDPCMGSGHFLVAELSILVAIRMKEEHLTQKEAVRAVLRDNLFGLEVDSRCTQIAAFNVALSAWEIGEYQQLPGLNLACSGTGIFATRESWLKLANGEVTLRWGMQRLYDLFKGAPELGSLINPARLPGAGFAVSFGELEPLLKVALAREETTKDDEAYQIGVTAEGIVHAAEILSSEFSLVATNVPYLGRGKQDELLKGYLETRYPLGKADLATAFILRCLEFCAKGGTAALVTPQNWLFLTTYAKLRESLLENQSWNVVARLGAGAFETISGQVVNVALPVLTAIAPTDGTVMVGIDVSQAKEPEEKAAMLTGEKPVGIVLLAQREQLENPDAVIALEKLKQGTLLGEYATALSGCSAGDSPRFIRSFWETGVLSDGTWRFHQGTVPDTMYFGGQSEVIFWERERGSMYELAQSVRHLNHAAQNWLRGKPNWGKQGVVVSQMGDLPCVLYTGEIYDCNCCAIVPNDSSNCAALWAYCESGEFTRQIRKINQKLNVTPQTLLNAPFDPTHWQKVAAEKYPNGLPEPESVDPTQWLFHGRPEHSIATLQVAVARLMGYRWPAELDVKMRLSQRTRDLVKRCDELLPFGDRDGIVCISSLRGESSAAERLLQLLAATHGKDWGTSTLNSLLKDVGFENKTIEDWLRNGFFEQHCQLFHQRPFIWQMWDGLRSGFSVLVNYHKLNRGSLEKLAFTYLGDWITRQKIAVEAGEEGSDARLMAAQELQRKLLLILEGEAPYDVFVRWKPMEKQPLGWEPDLNDGVRLNIRPFMTAGVLRKNPKVNWNKDRGTDVASAPWYRKFDGERINDFHLALEDKKRARGR